MQDIIAIIRLSSSTFFRFHNAPDVVGKLLVIIALIATAVFGFNPTDCRFGIYFNKDESIPLTLGVIVAVLVVIAIGVVGWSIANYDLTEMNMVGVTKGEYFTITISNRGKNELKIPVWIIEARYSDGRVFAHDNFPISPIATIESRNGSPSSITLFDLWQDEDKNTKAIALPSGCERCELATTSCSNTLTCYLKLAWLKYSKSTWFKVVWEPSDKNSPKIAMSQQNPPDLPVANCSKQ